MKLETFSIWHWFIVVIILSPIFIGILLLGLQKRIRIVHSSSGVGKNGYVGYSWTYLIFGWFVPVFRGELVIGLIHLVITLVSFGLSQIVFPFVYKRQYMNRMLTSGWVLDSSDSNYEMAKGKLNIIN